MPVDHGKMLAARRARTEREIASGRINVIDWTEWPKQAASDGTTATIATSGGQGILVNADLADYLGRFTWHVSAVGYAMSRAHRQPISMHRLILGLRPGDKRIADHINRERLDNRRENLRACDRAGNNRNSSGSRNRISKYKGVFPNRARWMAQITFQRRCHHLGTFDTQEEAARVYNEAALRMHGDFASLNVVP